MKLTALWFITNLLFVVSFIFTLFSHRAVQTANAEGKLERSLKFKKIRYWMVIVTIITFVAMCVSFISNMKVNG